MSATDGNRSADLRIGGWLRVDDDGDDRTPVTELIPRVRDVSAREAVPPDASKPDEREIHLGAFEPELTDADEPRHRRSRRRPVALVGFAVAAIAGGIPLVMTLTGAPTEPDRLPPVPTAPPSATATAPALSPAAAALGTATPTPGPSRSSLAPSAGASAPGGTAAPPADGPLVATGEPATDLRPETVTLSLEAEGPSAVRTGQAGPRSVAAASGGALVGWVGNGSGNTLRFTGVEVETAGEYDVVVHYCSGETRSAYVAVNGTRVRRVDFGSTGSFDTVGTTTVRLPLAAGPNTVELSNPDAWAPDFDRIILTR